ncbi:P-loop containing nucleoside triphosphate hydrolase protein [Lophiotrema nucula]|uniref:P-loop containing nucleoside triphosphate hydrolase protein n=1 Tax=Lophiotrema nucula TaxID=690887 RepID=A0A6A5YL85_9PLEO|nr:P-loop containing nucleoside triphosphate hydrolase protein [Lophiotrema nucula]
MTSRAYQEIDLVSPDDIFIAVMGMTGSGKSSFIARCTGDTSGIGFGLESRTKTVSFGTLEHKGRKIRLIDTPGFDDSNLETDDAFILKEIAAWLTVAYSHEPPLLLSGVIYLHPISDVRMKGTAKSNLRMFKAMCGTGPLSCVVLATTMWNNVEGHTGRKRQDGIAKQYWNDMVQAGSVVMKHDDTKASALRIIDHILSQKKLVPLQIQQQLKEGKTVEETNAGQELKTKVGEELAKAEKKLKRAKTDLERALADQDNSAANEILEQQKRFEAEIEAKDAELHSMQIKAEELFKKKVDEMAKAETERLQRYKSSEEKMSQLKKELEEVQERQVQLRNTPNPPSYDEVSALNVRNDMLQLELKRQQDQQEIARFQEQQRLQVSQFEEQKQLQISQYRQGDVEASRRHAEALKVNKRALVAGGIGAAAGVGSMAAAMSCTVM